MRLILGLTEEFKPATPTEVILLQNQCMEDVMEKAKNLTFPPLNLYLRYQTTHERAYRKCLNDLLKLRSERQKEQIDFARQEQQAELHRIAVRAREGEADYQQIRKSNTLNDAWRQERASNAKPVPWRRKKPRKARPTQLARQSPHAKCARTSPSLDG